MNDWARCRAIFLSEPSCIPYLNVFPCSKKGGKRIDPRPLLQTFFFLSEKMSKKFQLVNFDGEGPSTSFTAKTDWKLCIIATCLSL